MKRNHTNHKIGRSGVSPYKKYKKTPYQYSGAHEEWKRDAMRGAIREIV